jgi:hypothetical protein
MTQEERNFIQVYHSAFVNDTEPFKRSINSPVKIVVDTSAASSKEVDSPYEFIEEEAVEIKMTKTEFNHMSNKLHELKNDEKLRKKHANLQKAYNDYVLLKELLK